MAGQGPDDCGSVVIGLDDRRLQRTFEEATDRLSGAVTEELAQLAATALRTAQAATRRRFVGRMATLVIAQSLAHERGDDAEWADLQTMLRGVELGMEAAGFQPWDVARSYREALALVNEQRAAVVADEPVEAVQ